MKNIFFENLNIKIIKNNRSKNMRLRLDKNGTVVLSMPKWTLQRTGLKFIQDNIEWIKTQQNKIISPKVFQNGMEITLIGTPLIITHSPATRTGCHIDTGKLIVSGDIHHLHRRVRDFIKQYAYAYIQQTALQMATVLNEKPTKITLRDTSSRWGSCSSSKHLSFCWKLALAPEFVLKYIIAHEVAHLKEMNHSHQFWATVALLNVQRADAEIWLRKNGSELQAWE